MIFNFILSAAFLLIEGEMNNLYFEIDHHNLCSLKTAFNFLFPFLPSV